MDKEDLKEIKRIEEIIEKALLSEFDYIRKDSKREEKEEPAPSIDFGSKEQRQSIHETPCVLWKWFKLSDCRTWTDKSESDDVLILKALDNLAQTGKIRVLSIEFKRTMKPNDVGFHIEVGQGVSDFAVTNRRQRVTRLYQDTPLKKSERDECILNVKKGVERIRARHEKQREQTFGKIDLSLESRLHHEKVMADYELGAAQIRTAKVLEDKKGEKKVHP
jgi:hypothetical protein